MRSLLALALCFLGTIPLAAQEPPRFADATLRAVQFVDEIEGWAVGDDGVILHTIDGGQNWERQPSGTRASLCGLHFLDNFTGFAVGRESLPFGTGTTGVILYTQDGGARWQSILHKETPGLHSVRFFDKTTGFVVGMGSDQQPSGVFLTTDAGDSWKLMPGSRRPGWFGGAFVSAETALVCGPWGQLAALHKGEILAVQATPLDGKAVRDVRTQGKNAWAVGDGGLVLHSNGTGGMSWEKVTPKLPSEMLALWDLYAVQVRGQKIWAVGRPGTLVLHSPDGGQSWQTFQTGQTMPLQALHFRDDNNGWAVGALGTILATTDGGKTWKIQRRGGHRTAVLVVSAKPDHAPLGTVAVLGGDEGYLVAAVRLTCPDPASAAPGWAAAEGRWNDAIRQAGGCATEMFSAFPLPQHLEYADGKAMARFWGGGEEVRGIAALEQQLAMAIRMWQPDLIITDAADPNTATGSVGALLAQVLKQACEKAGQENAYPTLLAQLALAPYTPKKLYAMAEKAEGANVNVDLASVRPHLLNSAADHTSVANSLVRLTPTAPVNVEHFRLLWSNIPQADQHHALLQGIFLGHGGQARREREQANVAKFEERQKMAQTRRSLQAIAQQFVTDPAKARQLLTGLEKDLVALDEGMAAEALFLLAHQYIQAGQWLVAREIFFILLDRFPTHRLSPEACRWLIAFGSSSEARRRDELKKFQSPLLYSFNLPNSNKVTDPKLEKDSTFQKERRNVLTRRRNELRLSYHSGLALADVMAAYGTMYFTDPAVQFCVQACHRQLGDSAKANLWYTQFQLKQTAGPWYDAARAELWLQKRDGDPPKPLAQVFKAGAKPFLDGRLDDPCWQNAVALKLQDAVGQTSGGYATEAKVTYDEQFLYIAVKCQHPTDGHQVPVEKHRKRDDNLHAYDRISLMLDLDRDYTTYFHLQADQRGCACEDCWGDKTWNPDWRIAIHSTEAYWQIEAAIPLAELTGQQIEPGRVWAFNIVRTIPGKGVQAFSIPADVLPRPEGFGLLQFLATEKPETPEGK
jgi:photosystem II stability/assembly factor-like uncharacterized protein